MKLFSTKHWFVSGIAEAPVSDVFNIMLEINRSTAVALLKLKGLDTAGVYENSHYFEINHSAKTITIRGDFWYEGIFTALEMGDKTKITYRINNIGGASKIIPSLSKWIVPIWQYKTLVRMRLEMKGYLYTIGIRLKCKTFVEL